jgi:hypothetical protein
MSKGVRAAIADVFGEAEVLPALSARDGEVALPFRQALAANEVVAASIETGEVVEVSIENDAEDQTAKVSFLAVGSVPETDAARVALLAAKGFRRSIPAGSQLVETRAASQGDTLLIHSDAAVFVSVHVYSKAV